MLAEGLASGWLGPRSECVTHGRARASSPTGSRFRFVALSPRFTIHSLFSRQPTPFVTTLHGPRPAGTPGGLRDLSLDPCDLDFGRPAAARSPHPVGPHHSPWPAGAAFDATAG